MEYRYLHKTNIKVSVLCLGTMTWGQQNSLKEAIEQLDYAFDAGINFIDTAEMYPVPPREQTCYKTEKFIGNWAKLKTHRDQIILATKITGPRFPEHIRGGNSRFTKENLHKALNDSLSRLKTDYIDLYQLHWPERVTNFFGQLGFTPNKNDKFTSLEEVLSILNELKNAGKIRHYGISNETPWGAMKYCEISKRLNLPPMVSIQNPYNLLNRTYEIGLAEISYRENMGLLAYSPMAFGVLSGKYLNGKRPKNARLTLFSEFNRYTTTKAIKATELYCKLAKKYNIAPSQMALSFVTSRSFLTSNIIGATTTQQLKENIQSIDIKLPTELLKEIEEIHNKIPNPCP